MIEGVSSWSFIHPELERPWYTKAKTQEQATQRFEGCWALRIPQGLLEDVGGPPLLDGAGEAA